MDCPKCGGANIENAVNCIVCGENMIQEQPEQGVENATVTGNFAPQGAYSQPNAAPAQMLYVAPPMYMQPHKTGDKDKDWQAICSMVCGILSIPMMLTAFGGLFTAIAAIIFSFKGFKSQKAGMAAAGIICGIIGLLISIFMVYTMIIRQILYPEINQ